MKRKQTREIKIGNVLIGNNNPVAIQSMTNIATENTKGNIEQILALEKAGCEVITHIIFGLPGESKEGMLNSVKTAVDAGTDGVKFTCLYILKNTRYEKLREEGKIEVMGQEEYFDIVESALKMLPSQVIVHRLTGDGPKSLLLAPMWTANKRNVINYINKRFS